MIYLVRNSKFKNTNVYYLYNTETSQRTLTCTKKSKIFQYFIQSSANIQSNISELNSESTQILRAFTDESSVLKYYNSVISKVSK